MMLSVCCNGQALVIKSGEQAHDAGGPLQKFFCLLWQSLSRYWSLFSELESK